MDHIECMVKWTPVRVQFSKEGSILYSISCARRISLFIKKESNEKKNKREIRRYAMGKKKRRSNFLKLRKSIAKEKKKRREQREEAWESAQQESWLVEEEEELALIWKAWIWHCQSINAGDACNGKKRSPSHSFLKGASFLPLKKRKWHGRQMKK